MRTFVRAYALLESIFVWNRWAVTRGRNAGPVLEQSQRNALFSYSSLTEF
jgi:hypothetical protein